MPSITDDNRIQAIYKKSGVLSGIRSKATLKNQIEMLAKMPLLHQPGYQFTYGLNTDLLGFLIQEVSGCPLDEFFHKRIFEPLEMNDTHFTIPLSKANRLVSIVGTFFWGGAFNTHYWVDPKENIIGLVFTQEYLPASYWDLGTLYKNVVYFSF